MFIIELYNYIQMFRPGASMWQPCSKQWRKRVYWRQRGPRSV